MALDHINVFRPFEGLAAHHEDRLTRAALIVMKLIPLARDAFLCLAGETGVGWLPPLSRVRTQQTTLRHRGQLEERESGTKLLSVFLTPAESQQMSIAEVGQRTGGMRLDGVLEFGDDLLVVIESKLDEGVPDAQACYLDIEGVEVSETRTEHVSWHALLASWQELSEVEVLAPVERDLLDDFWQFVESERRFDDLLPFTTLRKAGGNKRRQLRRLRGVLSDASGLEAGYALDAGGSRVDVDLSTLTPPARTAGIAALRVRGRGDSRSIVLTLWPGYRTGESRALFSQSMLVDELKSLASDSDHSSVAAAWDFKPMIGVGLVRTRWNLPAAKHPLFGNYLEGWQRHRDAIGGHSPGDLLEAFEQLTEDGILHPEGRSTVEDVCARAKSARPFITAGFVASCTWSLNDAILLDDHRELVEDIRCQLDRFLRAIESRGIRHQPAAE